MNLSYLFYSCYFVFMSQTTVNKTVIKFGALTNGVHRVKEWAHCLHINMSHCGCSFTKFGQKLAQE